MIKAQHNWRDGCYAEFSMRSRLELHVLQYLNVPINQIHIVVNVNMQILDVVVKYAISVIVHFLRWTSTLHSSKKFVSLQWKIFLDSGCRKLSSQFKIWWNYDYENGCFYWNDDMNNKLTDGSQWGSSQSLRPKTSDIRNSFRIRIQYWQWESTDYKKFSQLIRIGTIILFHINY